MSDEIAGIKLARWSERFIAWLIDFVIISIILGTVFAVLTEGTEIMVEDDFDLLNYLPTTIVFFAYWTILEYKTGQSIGKRVLSLKTTDMGGDRPGLASVAVGSFGKSFLLPLDVILGWILTNNNRQRLFNRIGNTLVVKVSTPDSNITYEKD